MLRLHALHSCDSVFAAFPRQRWAGGWLLVAAGQRDAFDHGDVLAIQGRDAGATLLEVAVSEVPVLRLHEHDHSVCLIRPADEVLAALQRLIRTESHISIAIQREASLNASDIDTRTLE